MLMTAAVKSAKNFAMNRLSSLKCVYMLQYIRKYIAPSIKDHTNFQSHQHPANYIFPLRLTLSVRTRISNIQLIGGLPKLFSNGRSEVTSLNPKPLQMLTYMAMISNDRHSTPPVERKTLQMLSIYLKKPKTK